MNGAIIEFLQGVARSAEAADHGQKSAIYQDASFRLGISTATLHRKIKKITIPLKERKRRCDSGKTSLDIKEAKVLSAYLRESQRANGKRLAGIESALEVLRANNMWFASKTNKKTGELSLLSPSAVNRALSLYRLHPEQLARPAPKTQMASLHPNHVWQIDPSLCVLYYLNKQSGVQVMQESEFYKNKPGNIERIEKERVWRYVITDHASGWIFVFYVLGAESGKNLVDVFIAATQKRDNKDPVHGIPKIVMVDPGSANTGAIFRNLCGALGVKIQVNRPGQPWAKGQVEKANDIVEKSFEHRLAFMKKSPTSIGELNNHAWEWMRWFNSTKIHSRTKETRYAAWMKISQEQLIIAPDENTMRNLSYTAAVKRKVSSSLTIQYNGKPYSLNEIKDIEVGEIVDITKNPWRNDDAIQIIRKNNEKDDIYVIDPQNKTYFGFVENAPIIGQSYHTKNLSKIDKNRKEIEKISMDEKIYKDAIRSRKNKKIPFNGNIDPMKNIKNVNLPEYIKKKSSQVNLNKEINETVMGHIKAAKIISTRMGSSWNSEIHFKALKKLYPEGIHEKNMEEAIEKINKEPLIKLRSVKL